MSGAGSAVFAPMQLFSRLNGNIAFLGSPAARCNGRYEVCERGPFPHALIAAMSGLTPMMFITRVKL
jgi:hypothetical protein